MTAVRDASGNPLREHIPPATKQHEQRTNDTQCDHGDRSREGELALLADIGRAMRDASICGLGQTASSAIESAVRQPELVAL